MTAPLQQITLPRHCRSILKLLQAHKALTGRQGRRQDRQYGNMHAVAAAMADPDRPEVLVTSATAEGLTELQQRLAEVGDSSCKHGC